MSVIRRALLLAVSGLLSAVYRISRASPRLWRLQAGWYPPALDRVARLHARLTCQLAALDVPAYRDYLASRGVRRPRRLEDFPETTKRDYVQAYTVEERCRGGELAVVGTVVDESSGSSGTPFNWVRGRRELSEVRRNLACYTSFAFPSRRPFVVNAYSMGAWATGTTTGAASGRVAMVKNTGPDLEKILDTLRYFGPGYDYLVTAYPPFLKHLRDRLDEVGFPWERYRIRGLVGGEGMTEALRDYLEERFEKVRSGYGASDLTIGVGGETDLTVWLRKRLAHDAPLRAALLGEGEDRIPMIFQYNPLEHYLETDDRRELVCTITSTAVLSPKVRYNVGDEALLLAYDRLLDVLRQDAERWAGAQAAVAGERMRLPLLFLFGRSDSTISYMGANIYPQDVEHGLYAGNPMAARIARFCLSLEELPGLEHRPVVNLELRTGAVLTAEERTRLAATCREGVLAHLERVSRDFAESLREDPTAADLQVRVYDPGAGPFAELTARIKNVYLVRPA